MKYLILLFLFINQAVIAQEKPNSKIFLEQFKPFEGQYFEGEIVEGGKEGDGFTGKRLLMQVMSYDDREVKIPFYVGEDKSRTWILTDRKSTRLNSSHVKISYAVFFLKKKRIS